MMKMGAICSDVRVNGDGCEETVIDASGKDEFGRPIDFRTLNVEIRNAMCNGAKRIIVEGVMGQRYIASACSQKDLYVGIKGTPGNNLGAFLNGPTIEVFGNAQDMTGNTMSSGRIVVHGNAWDVTGLAARGGRILVKGSSGTRVGIHMKEFADHRPMIVVGGRTGEYLGEYMAGGTILVLGLGIPEGVSPVGSNLGTGIHGGMILIRGKVEPYQLGVAAAFKDLTDEDKAKLEDLVSDYERTFGITVSHDWSDIKKIAPISSRPFRGHFDPTAI